MAIYSPTGSGNIHIDQVLTNISLGWVNDMGYVGDQLFPTVPVKKQADKYYVWGKESWIPETGDYRAPGTEANEIPGMGVSLDTYYAQEHALQIAVTDEERENADSPFSPDRDGTEMVTSKVLLGRELAMKNMVQTAANYASGFSSTLSGTTQWSDYTNSDPVIAAKTARNAIHDRVYVDPTIAVIPYQVMQQLIDHPKIIQRIQYTDRAILTPELVASVMQLPKVVVPGMAYGTSPVGTNGNAVATAYVWGKDVLFAYVPPRPGLKVPAFAYEFAWTYGGQAQVVDRWREEKRASDVIRMRRRYDLKAVGTEQNSGSGDYLKWITGYLYKAAVA